MHRQPNLPLSNFISSSITCSMVSWLPFQYYTFYSPFQWRLCFFPYICSFQRGSYSPLAFIFVFFYIAIFFRNTPTLSISHFILLRQNDSATFHTLVASRDGPFFSSLASNVTLPSTLCFLLFLTPTLSISCVSSSLPQRLSSFPYISGFQRRLSLSYPLSLHFSVSAFTLSDTNI